MIDDLEQAGYARRQPATEDRRVKIVALTAAGIAALSTAQAGLLAPPPELSRLTRPQQPSLARLLNLALEDRTSH